MIPFSWFEGFIRSAPLHPLAADLGSALISFNFIVACFISTAMLLQCLVVRLHLLGWSLASWFECGSAPVYVGVRKSGAPFSQGA